MEKVSTDTKFDHQLVLKYLKELNEDQTKVDIQKFHDLCKAFTKFSGGLGSLISWGFEDIHTKCKMLLERWALYPECKSLHEIIEKEMALNIHLLNGFNNEKFGYQKGDPYGNYESATRTILRLIWFLTLLTHLIKNLREYPDELMSNIGQKSYNDSIASFHPGFLREAINAAFLTVPTRKDFMQNSFGTTDKKVVNDTLGSTLKPLATFVARLWRYYKEKGITNIE